MKEYVTFQQLLMGRHLASPLDEAKAASLGVLWLRVNRLCAEMDKAGVLPNLPNLVSSGYRPPDANRKAGGAANSPHLHCEAVDLRDPGDVMDRWLAANEPLLEKYELCREHEAATPEWLHLDSKKRGGKYRTFRP